MNSGNSKASNPHRLLLKIVLSDLRIYYTWKNMK